MRDVVGRVGEEERRRRRRVADREAAHEEEADHDHDPPARERDRLPDRRHEHVSESLDLLAEPAALAQHDELGLRRLQVEVHDRVQQHLGDGDRQDPPRRCDRQLLQHHDRHEDDDEHPERVGDDAREGRHEELGERRDDCAALVPAALLEFLVVPVVHLDRVTDGAGGDEERHDQHQRIEGEADDMDESHPPERGDETRQRRT